MKYNWRWVLIVLLLGFSTNQMFAQNNPELPSIKTQSKPQHLPNQFIGTFTGKLSILQGGKELNNNNTSMQLSIYPANNASAYNYTIVYTSKFTKDVRAYLLTVTDSAKGLATLDERNGISIPVSIIANKIISNFTLNQKDQITMIVSFSKLMAQMELYYGNENSISKINPINKVSPSDPDIIVDSKRITTYQSATLIRETEPTVSRGNLIQFGYIPSQFTNAHRVAVWLPKDYQPAQNYAVIYMHDGQMLFDSNSTWNHQEWGIDELITKTNRKAIVVGVWNDGINRSGDYFPQKVWDKYLSQNDKDSILKFIGGKNTLFGPIGAQSDNYLKFLTTELKPLIDSTFRPGTDAAHTYIAGASMGGLISAYAICEYPEIFGTAICLSTHWPGTSHFRYPNTPVALQQYISEHLPNPKNHKIFFAHGTGYLDSLYTQHQLNVDKIMSKKGYKANVNWKTIVYLKADHKESEWQKQMVDALNFTMPVPPNKKQKSK